jgi:hypothetical protein
MNLCQAWESSPEPSQYDRARLLLRERHIADFTGGKGHDCDRESLERVLCDLTPPRPPKG